MSCNLSAISIDRFTSNYPIPLPDFRHFLEAPRVDSRGTWKNNCCNINSSFCDRRRPRQDVRSGRLSFVISLQFHKGSCLDLNFVMPSDLVLATKDSGIYYCCEVESPKVFMCVPANILQAARYKYVACRQRSLYTIRRWELASTVTKKKYTALKRIVFPNPLTSTFEKYTSLSNLFSSEGRLDAVSFSAVAQIFSACTLWKYFRGGSAAELGVRASVGCNQCTKASSCGVREIEWSTSGHEYYRSHHYY